MKKILALALTLSISVSGITMVSATTGKRLIGDVNGDGVISVADATTIQKYLANIIDLDDEARICADTDGNGVVSISDATTAQKYLAEIIEDFPANQTDPTDPESKNIIPEGGQVILDGTTYNEGEEFPANEMGMKFTYGDYIYSYNLPFGSPVPLPSPTMLSANSEEDTADNSKNGWYVEVQDRSKTAYGEILESINDAPVLYIDNTFAGCTSLKVAPKIPSGATGMCATFDGCTSLETAPVIPDSVTDMELTFGYCTSLEVAPVIPDGVTVMRNTFTDCTSLKVVPAIPSSVTNMNHTVYGCTSLTTAPVIPESVTGMFATFQGCTSLETPPILPDGVTNISYTFYGCTSLTTAPVIPSSVKYMSQTFFGCGSLTGEIEINASNLEDYYYCFRKTVNDIVLTGTCPQLSGLANTGDNDNVSVKGA